jgi:hypothetical protein
MVAQQRGYGYGGGAGLGEEDGGGDWYGPGAGKKAGGLFADDGFTGRGASQEEEGEEQDEIEEEDPEVSKSLAR